MPVYKDKEKETWFCKFYYVDWTGCKKQKKKEGFKRKKDALEFERSFIELHSSDCNVKFKNLVKLYLNDCKTRQRPTSYNTKYLVIEKHILPYFEEMPINQIDIKTIRLWQNNIMSLDKEHSANYLRLINGYLSAIFNYAVKYYNLKSNPVKECGKICSKSSSNVDYWTIDEFNKFMEVNKCVQRKFLPQYVAVQIMFWTGIRVGELLALTLSDFDFENHTLSINKSYTRFKGNDLIHLPKTEKSNRTISIPKFLEDIIHSYTNTIYGYNPKERLFMINRSAINYFIKTGCLKSGVKKIRVHDLRHSHASLLINMGVSPLLIQERLGHEDIQTTLGTYSHLYSTEHVQLADKLQKTFKNSTF